MSSGGAEAQEARNVRVKVSNELDRTPLGEADAEEVFLGDVGVEEQRKAGRTNPAGGFEAEGVAALGMRARVERDGF